MPTVTFHVLSDAGPDAHLRYACKLAEEAVDQGQRVYMRVQDDAQAKRMDDLLWTFADRAFLPHEVANTPSHDRVRVLIGQSTQNTADVLINLAGDAAQVMSSPEQIIELVPASDDLKRAARARFKTYRDAGIEPVTRNVQ